MKRKRGAGLEPLLGIFRNSEYQQKTSVKDRRVLSLMGSVHETEIFR